MHNTKKGIAKNETIERTVVTLRKRFKILLAKCGGPNRLAKKLSEFDPFFDESLGIYHITNAKKDRAGEEVMIRILNAMEQLAKSSASKTPLTQADKSLKRMGLMYEPKYPTTQKLKEKMQTSKPKQ